MADGDRKRSRVQRWAEFRFSIVGRLLSGPLPRGELEEALRELSNSSWCHPITGEPVRYGFSTIQRWYYRCLKDSGSPVAVLSQKLRKDKGRSRKLDERLKERIEAQYRQHPSWSYRLHTDNIRAASEADYRAEELPSYATVRRYMQSCGLFKEKRRRGGDRAGAHIARERIAGKEVRSFEAEYVGGLWHLDFHHCSRQVLMKDGQWRVPICLAVCDDHSRLCCHAQWYLSEDTKHLVHGLSQAIQKRGLPRALLTDNGSAMLSGEFTSGLLRLGVVHETTLPYSPYQNGKQERFFGVLEGRLVAMCDGVKELSLKQLNDATIAWVEMEYNRSVHEELGESPLSRSLSGNDVTRKSPTSEELRLSFRRETTRRQRRTDGTVSLEGKRFEVPGRYRHIKELCVRYAKWDLSSVHLVDPDTGVLICPLYPLDKSANADGVRRHTAEQPKTAPLPPEDSMAPLLKKLIADYAATGLPPAYLPQDEEQS